jgi:3-hydroxyisobutyrate dehydrogenase-like beta-hydroxyacid dehydrogenase
MRVGFIGLGNMGSGMAANLLKAGHALTVYNRTPAKAEALVVEGARLGKTPREAARGDVVITMLADDAAVESVAFGPDGVLAGLKTLSIHISMSTISVALAERLASAHQAARQRFVAAPVFGRPEAAAAGKLFIVASRSSGHRIVRVSMRGASSFPHPIATCFTLIAAWSAAYLVLCR